MTKLKFARGTALASIALMVFYSDQAAAQGRTTADQTAANPVSAGSANVDNNNQLQEITVTANKREQSLNHVGATVTALSGNALRDRQVSTLQDLTQNIPSLTYANSPSGTPVISLRGVGFYEISLAASPTVSTYVDQVTLPFPILASHVAFDLERVEVLKGPQGVLFGQNATGGAINFIAAKPSANPSGSVTLGYGRFNAANVEGFVNGPISSTLNGRMAFRFERANGWQVSNSRPGDRNGRVKDYMGRLQLAWTPARSARFLLSLNGWKDQGEPLAGQYIGLNLQHPGFINPTLAITPFSPRTPRAADWNPGLPRRNNRFLQASLRGDIDVTSDITLTSITAYSDYKQRQAEDFDGVQVGVDDFTADNGKIQDFSQELRLSNRSSNAFRWVLGGNYGRTKVNQAFDYLFDASSTNLLLGIGIDRFSSNQKMRNYAGFGSAEFDLGHVITLKGGLRYNNYRVTATDCGNDIEAPNYPTGNLFYTYLVGGVAGPYRPGLCYGINNLGQTNNGVLPGHPGPFKGLLREHNLSWRGGIDIKPSDAVLLYASVTRGYKAGSFPTVGAALFTQYLPVVQESVTSYEAGAKISLLDKRIQLNTAIYYYDYKNKQLRSRTRDPVFGDLDILQNIPKSTVKGAEVELTIRPVAGLTLTGSATYTDAKIKQFAGLSAAGVQADFADTQVPFTPKWQLALNADYSVPISGTLALVAGGSVLHQTGTYSIIGGTINPPGVIPAGEELFRIDPYTLVDVRVGLKGRQWRATLWGKNIFNEYYWTNVTPAFDTLVRYAGSPATYGATVSFDF